MRSRSSQLYSPENKSIHKFLILLLVIAALLGAGILLIYSKEARKPVVISNNTYFVSPSGDDLNNDGKSTGTAFKTLNAALNLAQAGDRVELMDGEYREDIKTKRSGTIEHPIRILGTHNAVILGDNQDRIIEVNHDNIVLDGFSVNGLDGDPQNIDSYADKLVYISGTGANKEVSGVKLLNLDLRNSGGECVRFRHFAQDNEVAYSSIQNCGAYDFKFQQGGKNGEGIYIGTAPEQQNDGKNPVGTADKSDSNHIHHNTINTQANECVDIKEASSENLVEYNDCQGQQDVESAGLDSRGNSNIFRNNTVHDNLGAGVRLGGDGNRDGIDNQVYNNLLFGNKAGAVKVMRIPQGKICGNQITGNTDGEVTGEYAEDFDPTISCDN